MLFNAGVGVGCFDILSLDYPSSLLSPSPWETTQYKPKYCLKGPLSPKQPTIPFVAPMDSPAPAALAVGMGHFFLAFPIQLHPLIHLIMVGTEMPSFETYQSNMTKPSTNVTSIVMLFPGFRSAVGVPVLQWVKCRPADLADRVRSPFEATSSQP